jgi:hypothetical protein
MAADGQQGQQDRESEQQGRPGADQEAGQGERGNQRDSEQRERYGSRPEETREGNQQTGRQRQQQAR